MTEIVPLNAPRWYLLAMKEIGVRELPGNRGPDVLRYIKAAQCGVEGDPWCAIFVNAMLELSGVTGTRSASSQSFRYSPGFKMLAGPALGAITVFWRGNRASGLGHVGFYRGESPSQIWVLGGNEGDMVQIEPFPKNSVAFGLRGYYWPANVAFPVNNAPVIYSGKVTTPPKVT